MRSASSIHAIHSTLVPGPRDALPRRCSRCDRLRPPLTHHPSSAVNGATYTARERECAPPCVRRYGRLHPGRGTAKEGTHPRSSGRRKRKEPFCAASHQQRQHTTVSTPERITTTPLAAQPACSSTTQGQRRVACASGGECGQQSQQSQKGGEKFRKPAIKG